GARSREAADCPPVQSYESFAEIPVVDAEHEAALERARVAVEVREEERLLSEAVAEAVAAAAALPETGEDIPVDVDETPAPAEASLPGVSATGAVRAAPSASGPAAGANEAALGLFGPAAPAAAAAGAGAAPADYVLDLLDEAPEPWRHRWLGFVSTGFMLLAAAFLLFVAWRNDWSLQFDRFGKQVGRAFGAGGHDFSEDRACVLASGRVPAIVDTPEGRIAIVRGEVRNICERSITRTRLSCRLDGPGGPWTDDAFPIAAAGASALSEQSLSLLDSPGEVVSAIRAGESDAGVVQPGAGHEFWCVFPGAAGPEDRVAAFRSSVEVTGP
ncbi:MAG: hypothetical protein QME96_16440, partial [Myxococcota bacterium]|nr:hypothetical protein [Myxococcota bacterium]